MKNLRERVSKRLTPFAAFCGKEPLDPIMTGKDFLNLQAELRKSRLPEVSPELFDELLFNSISQALYGIGVTLLQQEQRREIASQLRRKQSEEEQARKAAGHLACDHGHTIDASIYTVHRNGFVYVLRGQKTGVYKIGTTLKREYLSGKLSAARKRKGEDFQAVLLLKADCGLGLERAIQYHCRATRERGKICPHNGNEGFSEYFHLIPAQLDYIRSIKTMNGQSVEIQEFAARG